MQALVPTGGLAPFEEQLSRLRSAGLLRAPASPEGEHGFTHALIQEVAYAGLPGPRQRELHAGIVGALQTVHAGRLLEQAETLAYHAHRGEAWAAAALYARHAGQRAAGRSAYRDAAAFFEQAIEACEHLPQTDTVLAEHIDIRFELRNALFPTAGITRNLIHSQAAERLALQLGDQRRLAWATMFMARDLTLMGRPADALAVARRALALCTGDAEQTVVVRCYLALAAYSQGDYAQSAQVLDEIVGVAEAGDPMRLYGLSGPGAVFFRGWLAWALARLGQHDAAWAAAAGMMPLAEYSNQPLCLTVTYLGQGFALAAAGRLEAARDALRTSLDLCLKWDFYAWFTNIAACLGHVLSRLGAHEEGIDLLHQAAERTRTSGILISHANELAWLAEAHLAAGRTAMARQVAEEAIAVARAHEERGNEALGACVLAEVQERDGEPARARSTFQAALTLAAACGMAPLTARCQAGLARTGCLVG